MLLATLALVLPLQDPRPADWAERDDEGRYAVFLADHTQRGDARMIRAVDGVFGIVAGCGQQGVVGGAGLSRRRAAGRQRDQQIGACIGVWIVVSNAEITRRSKPHRRDEQVDIYALKR